MATILSPSPHQANASAGGYSLAGYDYQVEVSVWLALDFVVTNRLTDQVILEPATD